MDTNKLFVDKMILVGMDDAKITNSENFIIGTRSLATCLGVLLYNEEKKLAIVVHVSSNPYLALDKLFQILIDNKLLRVKFKYKIFFGYDKEPAIYHGIVDILKEHFKDFVPFDENDIPDNAIHVDNNFESLEFAFDASTGSFVTEKIFCDFNDFTLFDTNINNGNIRGK